jgi:hypothetical protein
VRGTPIQEKSVEDDSLQIVKKSVVGAGDLGGSAGEGIRVHDGAEVVLGPRLLDQWPEIVWEGRLGKLQPDGFVEKAEHRVIHILEVTCTIDDCASFDRARSAEKQLKYLQLCNAVREARPEFAVHLREFVVGIRSSLPILRWILHLGALGMPTKIQKQVMTETTQVTVEGSANVVTAVENTVEKW